MNINPLTHYSKDEFMMFCELYQLENNFAFNKNHLQHVNDNNYLYVGLFRDDYQYSIETVITFKEGIITIEEPFFYNDELEDTKPLFHSLNEKVFTKFNKLIAAKRHQQKHTS